MATTAAFRKWCNLLVSWAKRNKLDEFEVKLSYLSTEEKTASEYFSGLVETIVRQASD